MGNSLFEILIIFLLLLLNGVFAMAETAIVSARRARLQAMAETRDPRAQVALETANHPLDFLSSVQIGITLIGVLAGAFGGATFAAAIGQALQAIPFLAPYSEAIGFGIVVVVITYLSLVIGELVPKQIALTNPERFAVLVAKPMRTLAKLTSPVVRLLTASTRLVLRLLGVSTTSESTVTLAEVQTLVEQATLGGVLEETEQDMVEGVFKLDDMYVDSLMTPRTNVVWLAVDDSPEEIFRTLAESHRSRFPVAEGTLDRVLGFVQAKDFVPLHVNPGALDLKSLLKPALYFPGSMSVLSALEQFKTSRIHFAFIVDEYGGVEGIITPNDILEAIVGDINGSDEPHQPGVVVREDGSWLLDGNLPIERLKAVLKVARLPDETAYQTLGGFVLHQLGAVPKPGQHFEWGPFRFEVMDMDGLRVDKVLVIATQPAEPHASLDHAAFSPEEEEK